jgi:hypothetical protein
VFTLKACNAVRRPRSLAWHSTRIITGDCAMEASDFDEIAFFRALERSGARALLIGRRALVLLGLPVLTADYDFWIAAEDINAFNRACEPFGLKPTRSPDEARRMGRYVLENDEHVDVLVARNLTAREGDQVRFDDVWDRRRNVRLTSDASVRIPALDDLIRTKRVSSRPKDLEDIRLLEVLREAEGQP